MYGASSFGALRRRALIDGEEAVKFVATVDALVEHFTSTLPVRSHQRSVIHVIAEVLRQMYSITLLIFSLVNEKLGHFK